MASRRERHIAVAAATVLGLLVLDSYVLTPLFDARTARIALRDKLELELDQAQRLLSQSRSAQRRFRVMQAQGNLQREASATESSLLAYLQTLAQESRVQLLSIRPDRTTAGHGLRELTFQVSGDGNLRAVMTFLHRLESAPLPLRVREVQIAPRTEGADDLSMTLRVSSIWEESTATNQITPPVHTMQSANSQVAEESR